MTQTLRAAPPEAPEPVLDYHALDHRMVGTWAALVGMTWLSLVWLAVASGGAAAPAAVGGAISLPIWGWFFGKRRLRKARDKAAAERGTEILPADHWVTQETYRLAAKLGLPHLPWVATMPVFNAYAIGSGPRSALVVVGTPLLERLSREEVSAIIAHELGHIANDDMRRMTLAESFQKALTWFMGWNREVQNGTRWVLSWVTELWVLKLSRNREYWADAIGAALTSPAAMQAALVKIHEADAPLSTYERRNARLMFRGNATSLFSTHPTLEERVAALSSETYLRQLPLRTPRGPNLTLVSGAPAPVSAPGPAGPLPDVRDVAYARPRASD